MSIIYNWKLACIIYSYNLGIIMFSNFKESTKSTEGLETNKLKLVVVS